MFLARFLSNKDAKGLSDPQHSTYLVILLALLNRGRSSALLDLPPFGISQPFSYNFHINIFYFSKKKEFNLLKIIFLICYV